MENNTLNKIASGARKSNRKFIQTREDFGTPNNAFAERDNYNRARENQNLDEKQAELSAAKNAFQIEIDSPEYDKRFEGYIKSTWDNVQEEQQEENFNNLTKLDSHNEAIFQEQYAKLAQTLSLNGDPNDKNNFYDFRALYNKNPNLTKAVESNNGKLPEAFVQPGNPGLDPEEGSGNKVDTLMSEKDYFDDDKVKAKVKEITNSGLPLLKRRKLMQSLQAKVKNAYSKEQRDKYEGIRKSFDAERKAISRSGSGVHKRAQRAFYALERGIMSFWSAKALATDEQFALALKEASEIELATRPESTFDKLTETAAESIPVMAATTAANLIPVVGTAVGMTIMGGVEGSDVYLEMRARGYSKEDSKKAALLTGAAAGFLEYAPGKLLHKYFSGASKGKAGYLLGTMSKKLDDVKGKTRFASKGTYEALKEAVGGSSKAEVIKKIAADVALSTTGEGIEEALQEVASLAIPASIVGEGYLPQTEDGQIDWGAINGQVAWAGLAGATLGGVFSTSGVIKNLSKLRNNKGYTDALGDWAKVDAKGNHTGITNKEGSLVGMAALYDLTQKDPDSKFTKEERADFLRSRLEHHRDNVINDPVGRMLFDNTTAKIKKVSSENNDSATIELRNGDLIDIIRRDDMGENVAGYEEAKKGQNARIYVTAANFQGMGSHELVHHIYQTAPDYSKAYISELFGKDVVEGQDPQEAAAIQMQERDESRAERTPGSLKMQDWMDRVQVLFKGNKASIEAQKSAFFQGVDSYSRTKARYTPGRLHKYRGQAKVIADTIAKGTGRKVEVDRAGAFVVNEISEEAVTKLTENLQPLTEDGSFRVDATSNPDGSWSMKITPGGKADTEVVQGNVEFASTAETKPTVQPKPDLNTSIKNEMRKVSESDPSLNLEAKATKDGEYVITGLNRAEENYSKLGKAITNLVQGQGIEVLQRASGPDGEMSIVVRKKKAATEEQSKAKVVEADSYADPVVEALLSDMTEGGRGGWQPHQKQLNPKKESIIPSKKSRRDQNVKTITQGLGFKSNNLKTRKGAGGAKVKSSYLNYVITDKNQTREIKGRQIIFEGHEGLEVYLTKRGKFFEVRYAKSGDLVTRPTTKRGDVLDAAKNVLLGNNSDSDIHYMKRPDRARPINEVYNLLQKAQKIEDQIKEADYQHKEKVRDEVRAWNLLSEEQQTESKKRSENARRIGEIGIIQEGEGSPEVVMQEPSKKPFKKRTYKKYVEDLKKSEVAANSDKDFDQARYTPVPKKTFLTSQNIEAEYGYIALDTITKYIEKKAKARKLKRDAKKKDSPESQKADEAEVQRHNQEIEDAKALQSKLNAIKSRYGEVTKETVAKYEEAIKKGGFKKKRSDVEDVFHKWLPSSYINTSFQDWLTNKSHKAVLDKMNKDPRVIARRAAGDPKPYQDLNLSQKGRHEFKLHSKGEALHLRKTDADYDGIGFTVDAMPNTQFMSAQKDGSGRYSVVIINSGLTTDGISQPLTGEFATVWDALRAFKKKVDKVSSEQLKQTEQKIGPISNYQKPINFKTHVPAKFTVVKNHVDSQMNRAWNMQDSIKSVMPGKSNIDAKTGTLAKLNDAYEIMSKLSLDLQETMAELVYNKSIGLHNGDLSQKLSELMEHSAEQAERTETYINLLYDRIKLQALDTKEISKSINKTVAYLRKLANTETSGKSTETYAHKNIDPKVGTFPASSPVKPKPIRFNMLNRNTGTFREVSGEPVTIEGYEGFNFFVSETTPGNYEVRELQSGQAFSQPTASKTMAIRQAKTLLDSWNPGKLQEYINKNITTYGTSPSVESYARYKSDLSKYNRLSEPTEKQLADAGERNIQANLRDEIDNLIPYENIQRLRDEVAGVAEYYDTKKKQTRTYQSEGEHQSNNKAEYIDMTRFPNGIASLGGIEALFPITDDQAGKLLNKHLETNNVGRVASLDAGRAEYKAVLDRLLKIQPKVKAGDASLVSELTSLREQLHVLQNAGKGLQTENAFISNKNKLRFPGSLVNGVDIGNTGIKTYQTDLISEMTRMYGDLWLIAYATSPIKSDIYKALNSSVKSLRKGSKHVFPAHANSRRSIDATVGVGQAQNHLAQTITYHLDKKTGSIVHNLYNPIIGGKGDAGHLFSLESLVQYGNRDVGLPITGNSVVTSHEAQYLDNRNTDDDVKQTLGTWLSPAKGTPNFSADAFASDVIYQLREVYMPKLTEGEMKSTQWKHQVVDPFEKNEDGSPKLDDSSVAAYGMEDRSKVIANIMQYANTAGYTRKDIERTLGEILVSTSNKYRDMLYSVVDNKNESKKNAPPKTEAGQAMDRANRELSVGANRYHQGTLTEADVVVIAAALRKVADTSNQTVLSEDALEEGIVGLLGQSVNLLSAGENLKVLSDMQVQDLKKTYTGVHFMAKPQSRAVSDRIKMNYSGILDQWFGMRDVAHVKNQVNGLALQEGWNAIFGITPQRKMRDIAKNIAKRTVSLNEANKREESRKYSLATQFLLDAMNYDKKTLSMLNEARYSVNKRLNESGLSSYDKAVLDSYTEAIDLAIQLVPGEGGSDVKYKKEIHDFIENQYVPTTNEDFKFLTENLRSKGGKTKYYVPRLYVQGVTDALTSQHGTFNQSTGRKKSRVYDGLGDAIKAGETLEHESFLDARLHGHDQVINAAADANMIATGLQAKYFSTTKKNGYELLNHPGAVVSEVNKDTGEITQSELYAPKEFADHFNKITAGSMVRQNKFMNGVISVNAKLKMMKILFGMFHRRSFVWSALMGGPLVMEGNTVGEKAKSALKNVNYAARRQEGWDAIQAMDRETTKLLQHMTLFKIQDYDASAGNRRGATSKFLMSGKKGGFRSKLNKANQQFEDVKSQYQQELFGVFGASLKLGTAKRELAGQLKKHQEAIGSEKQAYQDQHGGSFEEAFSQTEDTVYREVGKLMDRDFGGLNYDKMGVSRTTQDILRLLLLGPDWSFSNVLSMAGTFKSKNGKFGSSQTKIGAEMHRKFWGRIALRGAIATILVNLVGAGLDDEDYMERTKKSWEQGGLKWLMADISPFIHSLGGSEETDYYLNMFGHFLDPVKWAVDPIGSVHHKSSAVAKPLSNLLKGSNFRGQGFTNFWDIPEEGLTSNEARTGPTSPTAIPSWLTNELINAAPIQIKSLLHFFAGQTNAIKALAELGIGADIKQTYGPSK